MNTTDFSAIPKELTARRQWLVWRWATRDGKRTKIPSARVNDPRTFLTFKLAVALTRGRKPADGIGWVFTEGDPFVGIDLDACVSDGVVAPAAQKLIDDLDSYTEVSPSGNGVHVFVLGEWPESARNRTVGAWGGSLEAYDRARYFTVSGNGHGEIAPRQPQLDRLAEQLGPRQVPPGEFDWRQTAPDGVGFEGTDAELLDRARGAANGERFTALYDRGDLSHYPSHSEADLALVSMLAFWAGPSPTRLVRLFRGSALYREDFERDSYKGPTIAKALADRDHDDYYQERS
jgi:putative DNA primase/helicase